MFAVRAATVADISAVARVDVETWRATYAGLLPERLLVGLNERQRAAAWLRFVTRRPGHLIVATDARDAVIGFGSCGVQREPDLSYAGEVFTLYVAPDAQGQGAGRLLLLSLFQRLVRNGLYSGVIWVLSGNPSRFFYERLGGKAVAAHPIEMGRFRVDAIAYGWRDLASAITSRCRTPSRLE